jgi:lipopolysaccharide transport system ATP-binding protein
MTKNIAIEVQTLTKKYKLYDKPIDRFKESLNFFGKKYHVDFEAVKNLSFDIIKGETVGIIGRNGCGKSTLLKMITNVLTPSSGRVIVHGHISAILELGSGFNPEMTGLENIYLNTAINGYSKKQTDTIVEDIEKFAELGEFIHQPTKMYSSGMSARLAFAVAINVKPDILIVDEALSVGDAAFQRKCFAKMEEIRANGATILFVSHSEASIVSLCNRAIWISKGEKILDGDPKLVTSLYTKHINGPITQVEMKKEYEALVNSAVKLDETVSIRSVDTETKSNHKKEQSQSNLTYFNPSLKPTAMIEYESKGVLITDVKITSLCGEKLNVLSQGENYIYSFDVIVSRELGKIHFGMHMKDVKGNVLAGSAYPSKNEFISVRPGKYKLSFKFTNLFNCKEVFCSAGVKSSDGNFLHRMVDNYLFMVVNDSSKNTGLMSLVLSGELN